MAIDETNKNIIPNGLDFDKMRYRMEDKNALGGMNYKVYTGDGGEVGGENSGLCYTKGEEIGVVLDNWFFKEKSIELKYPDTAGSNVITKIKIGTEATSTGNSLGISIGYNNTADFQTSIAIGNGATSKSSNAVQIGAGTNVTSNSLRFMDKTIVSYDDASGNYLINADTAKTAEMAGTAEKSINLCDSDGMNYLSASKIGSYKYILPSDSDVYIGNDSKKIKEINSESINCTYLYAERITLQSVSGFDIGYIMSGSGIYSVIYELNLQLKTITFYYGGPKTISETTPSQSSPITCVIEGNVFGLQLRSDGEVYFVKSSADTVKIKSCRYLRTD